MTDADYLHAFQRVIMPIAMEFAPELVISTAFFHHPCSSL
jgi:histone deacetylase 6